MEIDPNNLIVQLCAAGMEAEGEGRMADAAALFVRAWETAQDDFEACIAAHYVARHQPDAAQTLHWNRVAVERATSADQGRVRSFYPSLYLNLGHSHEMLGDEISARRCYELAQSYLDDLPDTPFAAWTRAGVARALRRTGTADS